MSSRYQIRTIKFASGERFPLLIERASGKPLFNPTAFLTTQMRSVSLATSTMAQAARAIMAGLQILEHQGVDFSARLREGRMLELGEITELTEKMYLPQEQIDALIPATSPERAASKVTPIKRSHKRPPKTPTAKLLQRGSVGIRLLYFRDYLSWLTKRYILSQTANSSSAERLLLIHENFRDSISERIPKDRRRSTQNAREGLTEKVVQRALEVIDQSSPENPWKNKHVRARNELIFRLLHSLGIRRSEALILEVGDFNFRLNEVLIPRRPDDPTETRKDAPNTKTRDRLLPLSNELATMARNYITKVRNQIPGARKHGKLLVATGTGSALTKSAMNKIFVELRTRVPDLPEEMHPHIMRHTWNDDFSKLMQEKKVSPEDEVRMRIQQMGWSENSKAASTYLNRYIREEANKASLQMQEKTYGIKEKNDPSKN
jgi:integrase